MNFANILTLNAYKILKKPLNIQTVNRLTYEDPCIHFLGHFIKPKYRYRDL